MSGLMGKNAADRLGFRSLSAPWRGAYICGEETALLESLEGKKGMPRHEAAIPARLGFMVPDHGEQRRIHRGRADHPAPGPEWFSSFGRPNNAALKFSRSRVT